MSLDLHTLPVERPADLYTADDLSESGRRPVAEAQVQTLQKLAALEALRWHFRDDPQMYVMANMFVYFWNKHGVLAKQAPDIFAAHGVSKERRRVYYVEQEGKAPDLIIEFVSRKTRIFDLIYKPEVYAWLGVSEYFVFAPLGAYRKPRLTGFALAGKEYVPMDTAPSRLRSNVLGLDLAVEDGNLRFYDPRTDEKLLTYEEAQAARQLAEAQAQGETAARHAAEAENARLRDELARMQKKMSKQLTPKPS